MPELFYPASTVIILDSPPVVFGSGLRRNDGIVIMLNRTEVEIVMIITSTQDKCTNDD